MARSSHGHAREPLSRLLERSDAVAGELRRIRDRLAELEARFAADEPLGLAMRPSDLRSRDVVTLPEPRVDDAPNRERDATVLQEAARRRLTDER